MNNSRCMRVVRHCGAAVSVNVIVKLRVDSDYKCLSKCTLDVCLKLALKLSYLTDANACGWKRGKPAAAWPLRTSGAAVYQTFIGRGRRRHEWEREIEEREREWEWERERFVSGWTLRKLSVGEIQFRNESASVIFAIFTVFRVYNTMFTTTLTWYRYVLYL